jgi:hypothetical protein
MKNQLPRNITKANNHETPALVAAGNEEVFSMTAKTSMTTDQLLASLDKEALREVLVTLVAIRGYDVSDKAIEEGHFHIENLYSDKLAAVLEADEAVMREANSLACELDRD